MKKNDKLIVVFGVVVLLIASIGVYYWAPMDTGEKTAYVEDFFDVSGVMKDMPYAITVSESCPFYSLIATPVAVNYDTAGQRNLVPLYVKNFEDTSSAIIRAEDQIGIYANEVIEDIEPVKDVSIKFAEKYWKSSEGALIIEHSQEGYNLGVLATPFASYLSIPVIVTEEMDQDIKSCLKDLGVKNTIVCGDVHGYGNVLRFDNVDDIVNASIEIVREKFGEIEYITITNPIDIYEPEVLDKEIVSFEGTFGGVSLLPSQVFNSLKSIGDLISGGAHLADFTIPEDYKYALIKFKGEAKYKGDENPDLFGSSVKFTVSGPDEIFGSGLGTTSGASERDYNGNIITDQIYSETVVYDFGGKEFSVTGGSNLFVSDTVDVVGSIEIEKLNNSMYPMMKKLSAIAPYLTAYHNGIIFGKPEFAFVADDDKRTERDETCPGFYQPRINHDLLYSYNNHVFDIHDQINELLAKLADVDLNELGSLEILRNYYKDSPLYIALVGGNVVLPQIIYDSYLTPPGDSYLSKVFGTGTPSDVIYGNIDPIPGEWGNTQNDVYKFNGEDFPYQENIVGRITGWDLQDASALVARTIFYENIIDDLGEWKNKATVATGSGTDFLKPPVASFLRKITGKDPIVKWPSGSTELVGDKLEKTVLEPIGFDVYRTEYAESQVHGFTDEAIEKIQKANLFSRVFFAPNLVRMITGDEVVKGGEYMEECNIIWHNAHGMPNGYEFGDELTNSVGWRPGIYAIFNWLSRTGILPIFNTGMTTHGFHNVRNVENLNLGPSVMIIESCFCGKIDGMYPKQAISQAPLHAGVNALVAATTESNVPGGYLEPYFNFDRYNIIANIINRLNVKKGIYPDSHFGNIIQENFYQYLAEDQDVGTALRDARNGYLPIDIDSTFQWVPPLDTSIDSRGSLMKSTAGDSGPVPEHKYMAYYEYTLYGDPAFNPYIANE